MTTAQAVGAVSGEAKEWYAIDWQTIHRNVRRLQVRIAQATKASRWGKVRALQHLLTHSYSGKVLAVRRVTENDGKKTPGVDRVIWDTPEKKTWAVHELQRRGYQPQPLATCLHSEIGWQNKTPARHPHNDRSSYASIAFACTRSCCGNHDAAK